jgi:hypothetical protein
MRLRMEDQFETLESAQDFVALLAKTVAETKRDLESDLQRESASNVSRRLDALRIALYGLGKLELHVNRTSRILNDLRTLRRLLFNERGRTSTTQSATAQHASQAVRLPPNLLGDDTQSDATLQKSLAA